MRDSAGLPTFRLEPGAPLVQAGPASEAPVKAAAPAIRAVHERGVHYDDLCVADVMTETAILDAIDINSIASGFSEVERALG